MSKDLRFHLTDEQWQGILFQLRNARIGELEEEIEGLKGKLAGTAGARDHAYKLLEKERIEVARLRRENKRLQWEGGQEECGCGACVLKDGMGWRYRGEVPWQPKPWKHCPECGEELKA